MKKLTTFLALSFFSLGTQAQEMPPRIPHILASIQYIDVIRSELVKELKEAKDEAKMLEIAKQIIDFDKTIVVLHAVEHLHAQAAKVSQ
jgi:hypothetical protein